MDKKEFIDINYKENYCNGKIEEQQFTIRIHNSNYTGNFLWLSISEMLELKEKINGLCIPAEIKK